MPRVIRALVSHPGRCVALSGALLVAVMVLVPQASAMTDRLGVTIRPLERPPADPPPPPPPPPPDQPPTDRRPPTPPPPPPVRPVSPPLVTHTVNEELFSIFMERKFGPQWERRLSDTMIELWWRRFQMMRLMGLI
ncbi:MAG: hypothetical protein KF724_06935 [Phycisphaeraceae bacterium]|nr:hypothetical protein [Phycisphaeraceae bacterium]